jgi:uncharacterized protein (DUF1778 family)
MQTVGNPHGYAETREQRASLPRSIVGGSRSGRITVRSVVPVRLSDAERGQIAGAAKRLELTLSGFVRQAALEASARVERKVSVVTEQPAPLAVVESEPEPVHYVDGEPVSRGHVHA